VSFLYITLQHYHTCLLTGFDRGKPISKKKIADFENDFIQRALSRRREGIMYFSKTCSFHSFWWFEFWQLYFFMQLNTFC